jgi:hypothetical protein
MKQFLPVLVHRLFGGITEYFVAGAMALASVKTIEPSNYAL